MNFVRNQTFLFFAGLIVVPLGFVSPAAAQWVHVAPFNSISSDPPVIILSQAQNQILVGISSDCSIGVPCYSTTNNGVSWEAKSSLPKWTFVNSIFSFGGSIFCEAFGGACDQIAPASGLFRSSDGGVSWVKSDSGIPSIVLENDENSGGGFNLLYCLGPNLYILGTGIYRSTDTGRSWVESDSGIAESFGRLSEVDAITAFDGNLFASAGQWSDDRFIESLLFKSTDSGVTWNKTTSSPGFAVFILDTAEPYIYAVRFSTETQPPGGLYRSSDQGITWHELDCPFPPLAFTLKEDKLFIAGGTFGDSIYFSNDTGVTWSLVSDGMPFGGISYMLIANDNLFVASSDSGVWRRALSDFNSPSSVSKTSQPVSITLSPNPTPGLVMVHGMAGAITVTNVLGETVLYIANPRRTETTLDLTGKPSGTYFVRIENGESSQMLNFVKE